ncbi:MAG TPA: prepilin peptidase [Chloroflexia bacterium]|nr:prepilin peptidase [Chloroflexia bacterium]
MIIVPYILAALAGLLAGWITNVLAQRFPIAERPLFGPLHCVRSGEKLSLFDTLPVLGYALQRGRCRHCGKPLPWRFPLVEILLALAFMLAWPQYENQPLYVYLVNLFYIFLLATIGLIDWRFRLIFPIMIWAGCLFGLIVAVLGGAHPDNMLPDGLGSVLLGAAFGGGIFYFIYLVALGIYRRRALGFGDVLLAILIGVVLGFPRCASALFLGAVLGGVVAIGFFLFGGKKWRDFVPYGTTLCLGVILIIIWGNAVWQWGPFYLITRGLEIFFGYVFDWLFTLLGQPH